MLYFTDICVIGGANVLYLTDFCVNASADVLCLQSSMSTQAQMCCILESPMSTQAQMWYILQRFQWLIYNGFKVIHVSAVFTSFFGDNIYFHFGVHLLLTSKCNSRAGSGNYLLAYWRPRGAGVRWLMAAR